jgi:hypothetical protein
MLFLNVDVGIDDSGDALPGTWLAACSYPRQGKDVICIYYLNKQGQIRRASWTKGGKWVTETVSQIVIPDPASQITVAPSAELKQNTLAYLLKGNLDVQYLADPWLDD